jgi:predicted dehydrogenase
MRFGLLGTGYWAAETQAAGLSGHPDAELVGVWGRDPVKAAGLADRYGVRPYGDVDALLADVDAVAVALPPDIQAELAVRAATAGRHLLLDKPIALTVEAADRVVAAVEAAGVASVVFFTNRFQPEVEEFLGGLGEQDSGRFTLLASIFQPGGPYAESAWRRLHGGLWDVGPHALSVLLPALGPVTRVSALAGRHATTHALLEHAGGGVSTMTLSLDAPAPLFECSFHGSAGVAALPEVAGSAVDAFRAAVTQLAAGSGHPCDVHFGRDVVAVLEAAETSVREQRIVAL